MKRDLIIAGGGPAGLATALYAARAGLVATVVEPREGTIDKACGEGLMPAAVRQLRELGVEPAHRAFTGIRYHQFGQQADGLFRGEPGWGVRRLALHDALRAAVDAAGVERITGRVSTVEQDDEGVRAAGLEARYLVAADGLHSHVRRTLDLGLPTRRRTRLGLRRHYRQAPWSDRVEVFWSPHSEAYITPVGPDCVGVAVLYDGDPSPEGRGAEAKLDTLLADHPALRERLTGTPCSSARGAGPFEQHVRSRVAGRVLLVGDAAGYLDPITGEGIRMGLATAELAIAALQRDQPQAYEAAWRRETRAYYALTGGLLWLRDRPLLRRWMVPALRYTPGLFSRIVGVLGG